MTLTSTFNLQRYCLNIDCFLDNYLQRHLPLSCFYNLNGRKYSENIFFIKIEHCIVNYILLYIFLYILNNVKPYKFGEV